MDKKRIVAEIIAHHESTISEINKAYRANTGAADIDEESVLDREDYSRQNEATDMKMAFKDKLIHAKNELSFVVSHAEQAYTDVTPGAVVQSDTEAFYLGVSFKSFEIDGFKVFGISKEAPIYKELMNKQVGDTFELNNQKHTINKIS